MLTTILNNLTNIGWAMLIFLCAYLSNVAFSLYYNIKVLLEPFDRGKAINSALKVTAFVTGLTLLCLAVTTLPLFANMVGWDIPAEYADIFSDLVIIGAVLLVSCKYIVESFGKFKSILNSKIPNTPSLTKEVCFMMKASEFVAKAIDIAKNYKTLYVMGCFGAPMTAANKKRYTQNHEYNRRAARTVMINAASADTFGFDCVNLIKGILWGWCGDASRQYGGSGYAINGVPDIGADSMITKCPDASASGWDKVDPGEAVWCKGHIGIYIGDGLAVECTPSWANKVQITAVGNIGAKSGYKTRKWTKHGHLPYVEYDTAAAPVKPSAPATPTPAPAAPKQIKASGAAKSFDRSLAGTYTVTASSLNVRDKAGATDQIKILTALPSGAKVQNYGYYTLVGKVKWLYVQFTRNGVTYTGFCSEKYLRK